MSNDIGAMIYGTTESSEHSDTGSSVDAGTPDGEPAVKTSEASPGSGKDTEPVTDTVLPEDAVSGDEAEDTKAKLTAAVGRRQRNLRILCGIAVLAAAGAMLATLAPWWHMQFDGGTAAVETASGGVEIIELAPAEATRSGRDAGALSAAVTLAAVAGVAAFAAGRRLWWLSALGVAFITPNGAAAPPLVDSTASPVQAGLTTQEWGAVVAQTAYWVVLVTVVLITVSTLVLRHAEKRAVGESTGNTNRLRDLLSRTVISQLTRVGVEVSRAVEEAKADDAKKGTPSTGSKK